jgi:GDP-L-fucose synthase
MVGIKLCEALRIQHGFAAISLMPTNIYGPGDNYHSTNSHVLPALIRRFHEPPKANAPSVTCWGTGSPLREFLHVDDLGGACVFALEPSPA